MLLLTTLILLIVFLLTIIFYFKLNISNKTRQCKLPGIEPDLFFGNLKNTGILSGEKVIFQAFASLKEKFGDYFSFWLGPHQSIVLSRLEDVQYVLANRQIYDISTLTTSTFGILFPSGLISLRGDEWKRHARIMLPMLRKAKILVFFDRIVDCVDRFIDEQLIPKDKQIRTDLVVQCQKLLLNVISLIAFNYDLGSSVDNESDSVNLQKAFNDFVFYANQFVLNHGLPVWLGKILLLLNRKYQRALKVVQDHVMKVIKEEKSRQIEEFNRDERSKTLISSLVSATDDPNSTKSNLTEKELFDEVSLSILGGFETTSTALSWFIFYMSKYPHVQTKIKDELREHDLLGNKSLSLDILDSLIYIDCVTKEVLRFAPIAGAISRQAACNDRIGEINIQKGDNIILAIQNLHLDDRYWNINPKEFRPERFLNQDKTPRPCSYMPFGGGHRACAGQDLAFFELKIAITRFMQRITFIDPGTSANNSGGYLQRITCFPKHLAVRIEVDSDEH